MTTYISESIHHVYQTLFEALLLVILVVFLSLQNWRATLIPIVAVPISLIGTFGVMLVDARHAPTANDVVMANYFLQSGRPFVVVANKLDKLKKSQVEPALELIRETLELTERDILIPFSAEKGSGKDELLRLLVDACRG